MKVLILATDIYTRGGIARYTATLASALGQVLGPQNVDVLALLDWGSAAEVPKGFRIAGVLGNGVDAISKLRFALRAVRLGRQRYELVVATHVALAPIAAMIRLRYGSRFWVACHGVEAWQRLSLLRLAALRRADLVLPVSQFTGARLQEANGIALSKIRILRNAIPSEFAVLLTSARSGAESAPVQRGKERVVLSVGSLTKTHEYKGVDTMIRALPKIREAVPNVRYVVVGAGDNRPKLEQLAVEVGVAQQVTFEGEIAEARLAALYAACDLFALPSRCQERDGHWDGEGFGRVYVEAALAGKPVVGSRTGGAREAVLHGKTGLLVDPLSESAVVEAVVALLQRPEVAADMGAQGRQWALENFSLGSMCRELVEMLRPYGAGG